MGDIRSIALIDLVPSSIRSDPQIQAAATAINAELTRVTAAIPQTLLLARLDDLAEPVVDLLAWQWHVDFYEDGLPLKTKRDLIRQSVDWHRRKGTPSVVQEMVSAVLGDAKVMEWFEYGGDPYCFKVECADAVKDGQAYNKLWNIIFAVKNTRSWFEGFKIRRDFPLDLYLAGPISRKKQTTYHVATDIATRPVHNILIAQPVHVIRRKTIYPEVI